jgi:hypothetical protein
MKLVPISPPVANDKRPDTQTKLYCVGDGCTRYTTYSTGFVVGWHYNPEGEPFKDYYCPICTRKIQGK